MTSTDVNYYRKRADQERAAARDASKQFVAEIHLELVRAYEDLLQHPELRLVGSETTVNIRSPRPHALTLD